MVFSSATFLFLFLPTVYILYLILPGIKLKNFLLTVSSLVFYAWGEPLYVLLMIGSVFVNWLFGLATDKFYDKRKIFVAVSVLLNLGMLFAFKYAGFFASAVTSITGLDLPDVSVPLPIGISFFTFQILSYVIDVGRDKSVVQRNFFNLLLYISLFPQLIAGPIVKYHDVRESLDSRKISINCVAAGVRRFIIGLSKKLLIADVMAAVVDEIFVKSPSSMSAYCAWIGAVFYTIQIYFDFSGYSDMAIGLGKMLGFEFKENFRFPYISSSIGEFWNRWHISLSTWFKEYLYIPLGGNRKGAARTYINLLIVFMFTGLWHGANYTFVVWGVYNGLLIVLEKANIIPVNKCKIGVLKHLYTMLAVIIGFTIFRADSLGYAVEYIRTMFTPSAFANSIADCSAYMNPYIITVFAVACVASLPVVSKVNTLLCNKSTKVSSLVNGGGYVVATVLLLVCILVLASNSYSPFIYFRF